MDTVKSALEKRVSLRLLYFIMPAVLIAFIDRVNVSFAAPTMNRDLGIDPQTFGTGVGIFFLGYLLFEIPSNMLLARVGARFWISRIMIVWGMVAAGMSLASGPVSFLSLRFLLGVAEAGFIPGIMLYASYWIPVRRLGEFNSLMLLMVPIAGTVTALVSGLILGLDGRLGFAGWQWLYVLEGAPAILLGLYGLSYLPSRPRDAQWLSEEEKAQVEAGTGSLLASEPVQHVRSSAFANTRTWRYAVAYLCFNFGLGAQPWFPLLFAPFKLSPMQVGLVLGGANALAAMCMVAWGRRSDRMAERPNHMLMAAATAAVGFFLCATGETSLPLVGLGVVLALCGTFAAFVVFWTIPTSFLRVEERPVGIALVTCVGLVGSFTAPIITGWIKQFTGNYAGAMYLAAAGLVLSALVVRGGTKAAAGASAASQATVIG